MSGPEPTKLERIGPYRLEACLGKGGMGEVYQAYDERLRRRVAVKHVLTKDARKANLRQRLRREAQTVARLNHSAIVQIYDILETEEGDWIVMELVEGATVRELMDQDQLELPAIYGIAREVASGLVLAHQNGIVHRDLKVENVMVTDQGHAKILDFGLAKRLEKRDPTETTLSGAGLVVGTFRVMSPEQIMEQSVDARSDLFSFGTMLYEMCTGVSPFRAGDVVSTMTQVCRHQQVPAHRAGKQIPRELSDFIDRLLEKEPARRPQSALEVVRFFDRLTGETTVLPDVDEWRKARPEIPSRCGDPPAEDSRISCVSTEEMARLSRGVPNEVAAEPEHPGHRGADDSGFAIKTLVAASVVISNEGLARCDGATPTRLRARLEQLRGRLAMEHSGLNLQHSSGRLLMFERPAAAVEFALAHGRQVAVLAAEFQVPLAVRTGIHLGEVILTQDATEVTLHSHDDLVLPEFDPDESADDESTAIENFTPLVTRGVMALARPGQILLSQAVDELVQRGSVGRLLGEQEIGWRDHGLYTFPGIDEQVDIFEVGLVGDAPFQAPEPKWPAKSSASTRAGHGRRKPDPPSTLSLAMMTAAAILILMAFLWSQGWL